MFLRLAELPPDEAIIAGYLRDSETASDPDEDEPWPMDAVRMLVYFDPARAWTVLCRLIEAAPEDVVVRIGAGPLEEFLNRYGDRYVAEVEAASGNDNFVLALANVWLSRGELPPEVELRLHQASRGTITFLDANNADPEDRR